MMTIVPPGPMSFATVVRGWPNRMTKSIMLARVSVS